MILDLTILGKTPEPSRTLPDGGPMEIELIKKIFYAITDFSHDPCAPVGRVFPHERMTL